MFIAFWRSYRRSRHSRSRAFTVSTHYVTLSHPPRCTPPDLTTNPPMPPNPSPRLFSLSNHIVRPRSFTPFHHRSFVSDPPNLPPNPPNIVLNPGINFPVSPIPSNPLGEGKYIKSAAALIIGCVHLCIGLPAVVLTTRIRQPSGPP